jgi:DNA-binding transcriptional LysR family regulator
MHLTIRQLEVFEAVARLLSYTQAAHELHLSQPAVSMQIKQLEGNIGLPLLEQTGKKLYLTEAGREMYQYSRIISEQLEEADSVFEQLKGLERGKLKIAVASTASAFATRMLALYKQNYTGITVQLDVTNRAVLLKQLADNEKELVIMGRPPENQELEFTPFSENPLVMVASPNHPLAKHEGIIPLAQFHHESFVTREQGSGTRIAIKRFFDEHDISLKTSMEMNENESIKQAVQAELGLGIVSFHTLELELETRKLMILNVEHFPIMRHWYLVHRKNKRLSPAASAFKEFVLTEGKNLMLHSF